MLVVVQVHLPYGTERVHVKCHAQTSSVDIVKFARAQLCMTVQVAPCHVESKSYSSFEQEHGYANDN